MSSTEPLLLKTKIGDSLKIDVRTVRFTCPETFERLIDQYCNLLYSNTSLDRHGEFFCVKDRARRTEGSDGPIIEYTVEFKKKGRAIWPCLSWNPYSAD